MGNLSDNKSKNGETVTGYIRRRIDTDNKKLGKNISDNILNDLNYPLVILGNPGAGKTELAKQLGAVEGSRYITATGLRVIPDSELTGVRRIIIDGFDEVVTDSFADSLTSILQKIPIDMIPVILCRSADWRNANGSSQIENRWGKTPIKAEILPLNESEIWQMTQVLLGEDKTEKFIEKARSDDAYGLLSLPQNLYMFAEVWRTGNWPESKKNLFDEFSKQLITEHNDFHQERDIGGVKPDLLDCAGFICAQFLLSNGHPIKLNNLSEFAPENSPPKLVQATIGTKCFGSAGDTNFVPCHKTISEFLAAKWLSTQIRDGKISVRRLEELIYGNDYIVPAALRGLHAWLACLNSECREFIKRDPLGVFVYGDAEQLSNADVRTLLHGLRDLVEEDPYFTIDNQRAILGKGLAREALKEDIVELITSPQHFALIELIVESLAGSELVSAIKEELEAVLYDSEQAYIARRAAFISLASIEGGDVVAMFEKLSKSDEENLLRIAVENCRNHLDVLDGAFLGRLFFRFSAVAHGLDGSGILAVGWEVEKVMSSEQLQDALKYLAGADRDGLETSDENESIDDFIIKMLSELKLRNNWPATDTIFFLLKGMNPHGRAIMSMRSGESFFEDLADDQRHAIFIYSLLQGDGEGVYAETLWWLNDSGLSLQNKDVLPVFKALMEQKSDLHDWRDCLRVFVQFYRQVDGIIETAGESATGDEELLDFIEKVTAPSEPPEWQIRIAERRAERDLQIEKQNRERHESYENIQDKLEKGSHLSATNDIARAYLGQMRSNADTPEGRVLECVGEKAFKSAMASITAAIENNEIPSARDIASLHAKENKNYRLEFVLLAYCGQILSRSGSLGKLDDGLVLSALASFHWDLNFGQSETVDPIKQALRKIVYADERLKECYLRDTIEPYLEVGDKDFIQGPYQLAHEQDFETLAGKLSIEWLVKYKDLHPNILKDIGRAAVRYARGELLPLIPDRLDKATNDEEENFWMRLAMLFDFDAQEERLVAFIEKAGKKAIWVFKRPIFWDEGFYPKTLKPKQLWFLISNFAPHWSYVDHPRSGWVGDQNPWDAFEQINGWIRALAADLSDEAAQYMSQLSNYTDIPDYMNLVKHLRAEQSQNRAEQNKTDYSLEEVRGVLLAGPPKSVEDLQALLIDELRDAERQIRGSDTQTLDVFWNDDKPCDENDCRNRLVEALRPRLRLFETTVEAASVGGRFVDIEVKVDGFTVPIEAKGQWHNNLWSAANNQLQTYTEKYGADGHGIYLVFWFGDTETRKLKKRPKAKASDAPQSALELEDQLNEYYSDLSPKTKIVVLDLSKE